MDNNLKWCQHHGWMNAIDPCSCVVNSFYIANKHECEHCYCEAINLEMLLGNIPHKVCCRCNDKQVLIGEIKWLR